MALAPVGDPQRPLQLAIRSTRLLGIVLVCLGSLILLAMSMMNSRGMRSTQVILIMGFSAAVYLLPGIIFVVLAVFLGRRQPWAVTAAMVVAAVELLIAIVAVIGSLVQINIMGMVISALWVAAMIQLLMHLSKSFAAIRAYTGFTQRGFEPLQPGTFPPPPPPMQ